MKTRGYLQQSLANGARKFFKPMTKYDWAVPWPIDIEKVHRKTELYLSRWIQSIDIQDKDDIFKII